MFVEISFYMIINIRNDTIIFSKQTSIAIMYIWYLYIE